MHKRLRIAVVGPGFGAEFVPIYLAHPDVAEVGICDADPAVLASIGDRLAVERRFTDVQQVLHAGFDAIHLVTPLHLHAAQAIAALAAGMHSTIDAVTAANWTAAGICAHQSAMTAGASVRIPSFTDL